MLLNYFLRSSRRSYPSLLHTLISISLGAINSGLLEDTREKLSSANDSEWQSSVIELYLHRLLPLVFYSLQTNGLTDTLPQRYLITMEEAYNLTNIRNRVTFLMLGRILQNMEKSSIQPVLWKGVVLADYFYPNFGTRPMKDIDFAISPDEMTETTRVFKALNFLPQEQMETEDAVYFVNSKLGIICDVHHRVRLFEGKESDNLTIGLEPEKISFSEIRVLEANAMITHLIVHMDGHYPETGPMLCWILDLIFVLRKWGKLIQLEQLERLMPEKKHLVSLFRIIRFLETEFNEEFPICLTKAAKPFTPFTLEEIIRQRKLVLWGLPTLRGWLRLGVNQLGLPLQNSRPELSLNDLLSCPADLLRNYRNSQIKTIK